MAAKKKRKKARSKKANPTKRTTTKKRTKKRNPSHATHTKKRRTGGHKRSSKRNPSHKRRARKRNPGKSKRSGALMQAAIATAAGLAAFVGANVVNQLANSSFDPMVRRGIAGAGVVAGLALSTKKPLLGAGVAAGAAVMLAGSELTMQAFKVLPAKSGTAAVALMGDPRFLTPGDERMGAVMMGAPHLLGPGSETMGALDAPGAPWLTATPVG